MQQGLIVLIFIAAACFTIIISVNLPIAVLVGGFGFFLPCVRGNDGLHAAYLCMQLERRMAAVYMSGGVQETCSNEV